MKKRQKARLVNVVLWLASVCCVVFAASILMDPKADTAGTHDVIEVPLPSRSIDTPVGSTPTIYHGPGAICWDTENKR